MDENQDLTIGLDGAMKEGSTSIKVDVNTEGPETKGPEINIISPPPAEGPKEPTKVQPTPEVKQNVLKIDSQEQDDALDHVQPAPSEPEPSVIAQGQTQPTQEAEMPKPQGANTPKTDISAMAAQNTNESNTLEHKVKSSAHNRNNKKLAATVTVLVALSLAGAAIYVYLSTQNNAEKTVKSAVTFSIAG